MSRKPAGLTPQTRICCLTGKEEWTSPERGSCQNRRHGHMTLAKVEALVHEQRMEWITGRRQVLRKGIWYEEDCWVPVARFVIARKWRKRLSKGKGAPVACMQLVA